METILSTLTYILFILLALGNLLAFINHCRNLKKIETMAEKLKKLEEEINEKFNVISVDVSVNDNNIKNIKDFVGYKDSFERLQFADYYASIIKRFFKSNQWTNKDFEDFTSVPISDDILESGIESYVEAAINKALQVSEKILKSYADEYERRLEHPDPIVIKAETLPEDWHWINYDDASGHLESRMVKAIFLMIGVQGNTKWILIQSGISF